MSLFFTLGWILIGVLSTATVIRHWDRIRNWLNTTAADFVGRYLGYSARTNMQRAVVVLDRVFNGYIRQRTIIESTSPDGKYVDEVTVETMYQDYEIDDELLQEIARKKQVRQIYQYNKPHAKE